MLDCECERYLQRRAEDPAGVVGLDVAGDEGSFPLASPEDPMAAGVREAALLSVPLTLHAGEWPERFGSVENLAWAVNNPSTRRVGHAITVRAQPGLAEVMVERNITVEVCLTSNIGQALHLIQSKAFLHFIIIITFKTEYFSIIEFRV